jgi:hypothetical protein
MTRQRRPALSRRFVLAAAPAGVFAAAAPWTALAQPAAADPVSFYLGQVLALATLQANSIRRIRPFLAVPAPQDIDWQVTTTAEAGVIGAVASVLGAMEPPSELTASVGELRLASTAYQGAAAAAQSAATGETGALSSADAGLAEGAGHILLWLDALTAETGNDWGDGLRTLTLDAVAVPTAEIELQPAAAPNGAETTDPGDGDPAAPQAAEESGEDQVRVRTRRNRQGRSEHASQG